MQTEKITKNSSRPLAAQFFFRGHLLSKFSVFAEFVVYLPAATEFGVIEELPLRGNSSITTR